MRTFQADRGWIGNGAGLPAASASGVDSATTLVGPLVDQRHLGAVARRRRATLSW